MPFILEETTKITMKAQEICLCLKLMNVIQHSIKFNQETKPNAYKTKERSIKHFRPRTTYNG